MAGCSPTTVRTLLELDEVEIRTRLYPPVTIDREWFEREYVHRRRTLKELAGERGVSSSYVADQAAKWGIALRMTRRYSGIAHLNLDWQPSEALYAVAHGRTALARLAFEVHRSPRARVHPLLRHAHNDRRFGSPARRPDRRLPGHPLRRSHPRATRATDHRPWSALSKIRRGPAPRRRNRGRHGEARTSLPGLLREPLVLRRKPDLPWLDDRAGC